MLKTPPPIGGSTEDPSSIEDKTRHVDNVAPPAPISITTDDYQVQDELLEEVSIPSLDTGQATPVGGAPKTMRELAEDAERNRLESVDGASGNVDAARQLPLVSTTQTSPTIEPARANGRATRNGRRNTSVAAIDMASGSGSGGRDEADTPKVTLKLPATPARKSRKRSRADESDADNDEGLAESDLDVVLVESDSESDAAAVGDSGRRRASRAKRARKDDGASAGAAGGRRGRRRPTQPPAPVPKSDRVLRTRVPKSAAKVQDERAQELAYRRAVAE